MDDEQPPREPRSDGSFGYGFALLLLLHLLQYPMSLLLGGLFSVLAIGVTQLVYVIPVLVVLIVKKRSETAKGLGVAACITFLLNATCAGIVFWSWR